MTSHKHTNYNTNTLMKTNTLKLNYRLNYTLTITHKHANYNTQTITQKHTNNNKHTKEHKSHYTLLISPSALNLCVCFFVLSGLWRLTRPQSERRAGLVCSSREGAG